MITITCTKIMDVHMNIFLVTVHTSARCIKLAEAIYLTPTLVMKGSAGDAG